MIPSSDLDPRPDLGDDAHLWRRLLELAQVDEYDPHGLYGVLRGFRSCGARLERTAGGNLRVGPGELGSEYAALRDEWLVPHRVALVELLRQVATNVTEAA